MKLNDLNIICLETVLEYLEIIELLIVADANKRLRHAASMVYQRKYGEMQWFIKRLVPENWDLQNPIHIESYVISRFCQIDCLKFTCQLLRCFGYAVTFVFCFDHLHYSSDLTEFEC